MRRKIQRSMILVIAATLLVSMALLTFVVYRQNVGLMEEEARQEAGYICAAIEASGSAYLEEMDAQQEETRVTWIGSDGDVLYDSSEGQEDMENHADRPEVREAEHAIAYLRSIEAVTGLTCSGIVNNTHLCGETTPAEIRKGAALAEAVSRQTGIPILCHTAEVRFADAVSDLREPVFPITINMKKPWER